MELEEMKKKEEKKEMKHGISAAERAQDKKRVSHQSERYTSMQQ